MSPIHEKNPLFNSLRTYCVLYMDYTWLWKYFYNIPIFPFHCTTPFCDFIFFPFFVLGKQQQIWIWSNNKQEACWVVIVVSIGFKHIQEVKSEVLVYIKPDIDLTSAPPISSTYIQNIYIQNYKSSLTLYFRPLSTFLLPLRSLHSTIFIPFQSPQFI